MHREPPSAHFEGEKKVGIQVEISRARCSGRVQHPRFWSIIPAGMMSVALTAAAMASPPPPVEFVGTATGPGGTFDVLQDGRLLGVSGDQILRESSIGSGVFEVAGLLPSGSVNPFGASFISINPGSEYAMVGDGNFGGASVLGFALADLDGGPIATQSFAHENFSAAWLDDDRIAITYADQNTFMGSVSVLDRRNAESITLMSVGGASAGIAFASDGSLLTGNGFDMLNGGSETGEIRAFSAAMINDVLNNQSGPIDFETQGTLIGEFLSAGSLGFDGRGDLFVGGGDFAQPDNDYFALLDAAAINDALNGQGPVSFEHVFADDPDGNPGSFYSARFNAVTNEWLVYNGSTDLLYRYRIVPAPATVLTMTLLLAGTLRRRSGVRA